ncbi:hypothetical protein HDU67_004936 [Dinochytrium kinnereticum]|nr:hypothetical protein HDU67_004936 [Dinochytrium kinnereticum]
MLPSTILLALIASVSAFNIPSEAMMDSMSSDSLNNMAWSDLDNIDSGAMDRSIIPPDLNDLPEIMDSDSDSSPWGNLESQGLGDSLPKDFQADIRIDDDAAAAMRDAQDRAVSSGLLGWNEKMRKRINRERATLSMSLVTVNKGLVEKAQKRAQKLANEGCTAHYDKVDGKFMSQGIVAMKGSKRPNPTLNTIIKYWYDNRNRAFVIPRQERVGCGAAFSSGKTKDRKKPHKTVLAPLAEAVTALILIISEAEISKTPMPDLSALAKIVDDQIRSLVGVGKRIAGQSGADDMLREGMPGACDEVLKASDLLLTSTSQLVRDPYSSPGRSQLLESVRGILRGTTMVLTTFDDAEIRRILSASRQVRSHLSRIDTCAPSLETPDKRAAEDHRYAVAVAVFGQAVVTLGQLAFKRVGELLVPDVQTRLRCAVDGIVRESPLVMAACTVALRNPGVAEAKGVRAAACARLANICKEIEIVVQLTGEEMGGLGEAPAHDNVKQRKRVDEAAGSIRSAVVSGSEPALKQALIDYQHATNTVIADTRRTLETLKSPEAKTALHTLTESLTTALPKISTAAHQALERPESPRHHQDLLSLLDLSAEKLTALTTSRSRFLIGDLTVTASTLSDRRLIATPYVQFLEAVHKGQKPRFSAAVHDLEGEAGRLVGLAALVQEVVGGEVGKEVGVVKGRVGGLVEALVSAGGLAVLNSGDGASKDYLEGVCEAWEGGVRELLGGVLAAEGGFKVNDLLVGTKNALDKHSEALGAASNLGDTEKVRKESNDMVACATQILTIARKEAEVTEDQGYRANLEVKIREVEKVIPLLLGKSRSIAESHKITAADASAIQTHVKDLTGRFMSIGDLIRAHKGIVSETPQEHPTELPASPDLSIQGISVQLLENVLSDVVFVDEEPPVMLTEVEAKANPIQAAAQELKIEASHWTSKDNPIIHAAQKMSDRLTDLSHHHHQLRKDASPEAKRAFITAAQQIMSEASAIVLASRPIADACSDKRLKTALLLTLDRIDTLAQQLKIIAAVKTSAPGDTDRDLQLVGCAQNLMVAVKACLNHAEAGSLRIAKGEKGGGKVGGGHPPLAIRFRRNVYRSKRLAPAR